MAMPLQILGFTWPTTYWMPQIGPFLSSAGNVYTILPPSGQTALGVFKCSDPDTGSFAEVDGANRPALASTVNLCWRAHQVGDKLHVVSQDNNAGVSSIRYMRFDMSTDSWDIITGSDRVVVVSAPGTPTSTLGDRVMADITVLSTGKLRIVCQGAAEKIMGTDYGRPVIHTSVNDGALWSSAIAISPTGTQASYLALSIVLPPDNSDQCFVWYAAATGMHCRGVAEDNTIRSTRLPGRDIDTTTGIAPLVGALRGSTSIMRTVINRPGPSQVWTIGYDAWTDDTNPGFAEFWDFDTTQGIPYTSNNPVMACAFYGSEFHVLRARWSDRTILHDRDLDADDYSGTTEEVYVGTNQFLSCNAYERGGIGVFGYVVMDDGSLYYDEIALEDEPTEIPTEVPTEEPTATEIPTETEVPGPYDDFPALNILIVVSGGSTPLGHFEDALRLAPAHTVLSVSGTSEMDVSDFDPYDLVIVYGTPADQDLAGISAQMESINDAGKPLLISSVTNVTGFPNSTPVTTIATSMGLVSDVVWDDGVKTVDIDSPNEHPITANVPSGVQTLWDPSGSSLGAADTSIIGVPFITATGPGAYMTGKETASAIEAGTDKLTSGTTGARIVHLPTGSNFMNDGLSDYHADIIIRAAHWAAQTGAVEEPTETEVPTEPPATEPPATEEPTEPATEIPTEPPPTETEIPTEEPTATEEVTEYAVRVGDTLAHSDDTWSYDPTSFTTQWYRDDVAIDGANGDTYEVVIEDVGAMIKLGKIATNNAGDSDEVFSNALGPVGPAE